MLLTSESKKVQQKRCNAMRGASPPNSTLTGPRIDEGAAQRIVPLHVGSVPNAGLWR